jgi:hypothetical protein
MAERDHERTLADMRAELLSSALDRFRWRWRWTGYDDPDAVTPEERAANGSGKRFDHDRIRACIARVRALDAAVEVVEVANATATIYYDDALMHAIRAFYGAGEPSR